MLNSELQEYLEKKLEVMTKIIIQWNRDECYVNGPELEQLYKFEDSSNSFVADNYEITADTGNFSNKDDGERTSFI